MYTDMPEAELRAYRSTTAEPSDFDGFWRRTLAEAREHPVAVEQHLVDTGLVTVDTYDVSFAGWGGDRISAWLTVPSGERPGPLPTIVEYIGYGGGRGSSRDHLLWASAGYAHLVMDTRGQGSSWSPGVTADPEGSGPSVPGVMTRGIESPDDHYYRRLTTDAVRAVDAVRALPQVDADRVVVLGTSQGGGLAIAAGALAEGVRAVFARVPFLCDFPRATTITDRDPYAEIVRYLAVHRDGVDRAFHTLAHFDGVFHARRATCPVWMSTALMDPTCPPSTVFAAYNDWAGEKDMVVYPFNGHEGGADAEDERTLRVLRTLFPPRGTAAG